MALQTQAVSSLSIQMTSASVVIETPKGSRNKFAFNADEHIFELKKVLPAGMTFLYDFGFVPLTEADDDDPVDTSLFWSKVHSLPFPRMASFRTAGCGTGMGTREDTTMTYAWYEAYKAAVLETDWTTMQRRLQSAEGAIAQRQRELSMDHGGTPAERQAIADALSGIRSLKAETARWQTRQVSDGESPEPGSS